MKTLMALLVCLAFGHGHAQSPGKQDMIQKAAHEYLTRQFREERMTSQTGATYQCPLDSQGCVKAACSAVGNFSCDDEEEIFDFFKACRGNYGGECVSTACALVGRFNCDDSQETLQVASACRGNVDGKCIQFVCRQLGSFDCDSVEEIVPIADACGGQD